VTGSRTWIPRIALVVLPVAWAGLAVTLPTKSNRDLTVDVSCASGNPVVAVWIESRPGGSRFARKGESGRSTDTRFTFRQTFTGPYQVRAGCGGTPEQWGVTVWSAYDDRPYRRLACDDLTVVGTRGAGCDDRPAR
jgi:hypothetical protein